LVSAIQPERRSLVAVSKLVPPGFGASDVAATPV